MKKVIIVLLTLLVIGGAGFLIYHSFSNAKKEYTIQYTDDSGTHTITVTHGMPYTLEVLPTRTGYDFTGLYDAEVDGTQYVSSNGSSLSPFTDKKNIVLFPQYKAKDYTIILDYQGVPVTGNRQFTVSYGSSLPELPKNLTSDHKDFIGWFTAQGCDGTQIADQYGLIPLVSVLNEQNFDISTSSITLFAGFEPEKHIVTFCFETGMETEDLKVAYDTPINQVVPKTRVNGNAVLTWSKTQGGEVWNGKVVEDMVLYAVEYAPVIEFDVSGGKEVAPLVARAGSTVALPTPIKDLAKFSYWEDMSGNKYASTTMPGKSISLKAVWQAKLVFDENGGTDVDDISEQGGNKITLPTPEKEGFIFAGWYTAEKEQYTSTTMPSRGVALKAGWYKEQVQNVVEIASTSNPSFKVNKASVNSACYKIEYNKYSSSGDSINIRLEGHIKIKSSWAEYQGAKSAYLEIYSQRTISSSYLIANKTFTGVTGDYRDYNFEIKLNIADDAYICLYHECPFNTWSFNLSDFYYVIYYPDTTNLYL